jgi:hypothetical protein
MHQTTHQKPIDKHVMCLDCEESRPIANRERTDLVGCRYATLENTLPVGFTGNQFYKTYISAGKLRSGHLVYGIAVNANSTCSLAHKEPIAVNMEK